MVAFHGMIVEAAKKAGIKVPRDPEKYDPEKYGHWHIFCVCQLGAPQPRMDCHWDNAKVVAKIPKAKLKTITYRELLKRGFMVGYSK